MLCCLIAVLLLLGAFAIIIFAKRDYVGIGIVLLIFGLIFCGILGEVKNNSFKRMTEGQEFAKIVLDSKKYEGTLDGDLVKVSATKIDVSDKFDLEFLEKVKMQSTTVDEITEAKTNPWLNWVYPKVEKPLLKIVIIR